MDGQGQNGFLQTYRRGWRARNWSAYLLAGLFFLFYVVLYYTEVFTPLAQAMGLGSKWYFYGAIYTLLVGAGALRLLRQQGNSRYQTLRLTVNFGVQATFGFALPFVMEHLGARAYYFSYMWPLKIEYFYPSEILNYPPILMAYSVLASLVVVPVCTVLYGKRWYCSWVCGCGALANTMGDPWRHLSSKTARSWRIEKWSIHSVLLLAILTTGMVVANWFVGPAHPTFSKVAFEVQSLYGFIIGFVLAAAVGVGAYPVWGTRVWCRFACPMAALLGLLQKLGRFHIRVKRDQCISCGNCSTYCEMGIDVRAYAERNESFTRASCVGCGVCAHVCPRGVLKLENRSLRRRKTLPLVG